MTKKIWRLLCIFSVFLAGILLYEGGVLEVKYSNPTWEPYFERGLDLRRRNNLWASSCQKT